MNNNDIKIEYSRGKSKDGRIVVYLRPARDCFNRSRVVKAFNQAGLDRKIAEVTISWYAPMNYYMVDGNIIGSNNQANALKEYWRVCDIEKRGLPFEVILKTEIEKNEQTDGCKHGETGPNDNPQCICWERRAFGCDE